jgi:phage FluMu gp28-like protein
MYAKLKDAPELRQEPATRVEFANGSRILSLPGTEKTVRGLSKVSMVIIDEAARVEDELIAAVRPMLAVSDFGGRLIALSTPFGKRGWFFEAWHNGGEDWTRVEVRAEDCPRIGISC